MVVFYRCTKNASRGPMYKMDRRAATVCFALIVALAGSPALAGTPKVVWAKASVASSTMEIELGACTKESNAVGVALRPEFETQVIAEYPAAPLRPLAVSVIGSVVGGFFSSVMTPSAQADYVRTCMLGRGYYGIALSPDEEADLDTQKTTEANAAWIDHFYGRADFGQRLAVASSPPTPPIAILPRMEPEPFTFGAVRFDPKVLMTASGVVNTTSPVLEGEIHYRRAARLKTDVNAFPVRISQGSIAYAVVSGGGANGHDETYWCGRMKLGIFGIGADYCVAATQDGFTFYDMVFPSGLPRKGLISKFDMYSQVAKVASSTYALDDRSGDTGGPIGFALVVKKVGVGGVSLVAKATIDGETEDFWSGDVLFDEQGNATLPFWTYRLVLARSGDGLTTRFTADGDGRGWDDANLGAVR